MPSGVPANSGARWSACQGFIVRDVVTGRIRASGRRRRADRTILAAARGSPAAAAPAARRRRADRPRRRDAERAAAGALGAVQHQRRRRRRRRASAARRPTRSACRGTTAAPAWWAAATAATARVSGARRRRGASMKNSSRWSRRPSQNARRSVAGITSPPSLRPAAATAAFAPRRRTASVSRHQTLALSGSGWPAQACRLVERLGLAHVEAQRRVGRRIGSTFSETSQIAPSAPHEPASRRETS